MAMAQEKQFNRIYTVSKLTRELKAILENQFSFVWIIGEISNYAVPGSGHSYFSLKDEGAVINCVMFRNQKRGLKFEPENGLRVIGLGRISVYEPRGSYQLIFEHMEPEGTGSLQLAFEQLKKKLDQEGLFDPAHKKDIPFLPSTVHVITSPTGAAVRDIIKVATRRYPNCCIQILPVTVQGADAPEKIAQAIEFSNQLNRSDLIILARGGGSAEDLSAFNSEVVARAVFNSAIPVITGIGHETDFTIADFVADVRAPTPSAAAEHAFPDKNMLVRTLNRLTLSMAAALKKTLTRKTTLILDLESRLKSPRRLIDDHILKLDDHGARLLKALENKTSRAREHLSFLSRRLIGTRPDIQADIRQLTALSDRLGLAMGTCLEKEKNRLGKLETGLWAFNPESVLKRGYSITRTLPRRKMVTNAQDLTAGDRIEVILAKGRITAQVKETNR